MTRPRLLALAAVALALSGLGLTVATQHVAQNLNYSRHLGPPLGTLAGRPVYPPWAWLAWDEQHHRRAPAAFSVAYVLTYGVLAVTFLPLILLSLRSRREPRTAHGSARWAELAELRRAGLLGKDGVVLCQTAEARFTSKLDAQGALRWRMPRAGCLVRHNGPEHVFVFAPTRSGKGVGIVIPTLFGWTASALIYDIKKELWSLTAGFRRSFSYCWRFEPTAPDSVRFNPLWEIRRGDNEVRDAQVIADILVDPDGSGEKRDHWQTTAHALLVGAILHVLYAESDKTLTGVATLLSDPQRTQKQTLERMLKAPHLGDRPHPVVAQVARSLLNKSENELSGVVSTATSYLDLFRDPLIARNTAASDFRIADLMNLDHPVSLYLVVPPSDISRLRRLVRLLLNQVGQRLTERMAFPAAGKAASPAYRHRLLFMLDEFTSLGRLDFFETQLAFCAGYGIKCFMVAQSLNQLQKTYGDKNSILDNSHIRITYAANDELTARRISELVGQATVAKRQKSFSSAKSGRSVTQSEQEFARPLLTPDEVLRLPFDEALLLVSGLPPYRAKKLMYYLDARMSDRAGLPPPDSPREQRAQLPRRSLSEMSDWAGLGAVEPPSSPPSPEVSPAKLVAEDPSADALLDSAVASFLAASPDTDQPFDEQDDAP